MAEPARALEAWTVATFAVVTLGLVGVTAGHASGALADALPDLGTVPGVAAFAALWVLTAVGVRWALADGGLARSRRGEFAPLVARGTLAGAFVGAAFVVGTVLSFAVASVGSDPVPPGSVALFALVGGTVAGVVGGLVGGLFVLVDAALYWAVVAMASAGE